MLFLCKIKMIIFYPYFMWSYSYEDSFDNLGDLLRKDSFDDAFKDDDDEPLVQCGKLEHLKEHREASSARLAS